MTVGHFVRPSACSLFFPFSAGTQWISTAPNYLINDNKVVYLKLQSASETRNRYIFLASSVFWHQAFSRDDCSRLVEDQSTAEGIGRRSCGVHALSKKCFP